MLKPVGYGVLVKLDSVEEKSEGGIVFASQTVEQERRGRATGTVVELGQLAYKDLGDGKPWIKKGDKVFFRRYSGPYLPFKEDFYMVMQDKDILGKLTSKDDKIEYIVG